MEKMPREKLMEDGAEALRDDELLAIMLGVGNGKESVFAMSKRLIEDYGFQRLLHMSYRELSKIRGIGPAKATKLMAVFEMVKRCMKEAMEQKRITSSEELYDYVYPEYLSEKKEKLMVIYTDSALKILKQEAFTSSSYTRIETPIKTIVAHAIEYDAYGIFLVHNHPAGIAMPSGSDKTYTEILDTTLKGCDILLLDHIIIAGTSYYSFSDSESDVVSKLKMLST